MTERRLVSESGQSERIPRTKAGRRLFKVAGDGRNDGWLMEDILAIEDEAAVPPEPPQLDPEARRLLSKMERDPSDVTLAEVRTYLARSAAPAEPSTDEERLRDPAEWHRYLHREGILLPDDGINVDGCGPWHHRVFLGFPR